MTQPPSATPLPRRSGPGAPLTSPTPAGFIGRYQLLEKIGDGGMGSLYLARDPAIDRLVAIKLLRRGFDTEALRERFAREARAAGRLRHRHIVTIFDVGEHEGDPFIAMEFLAGETLAELIRQEARLSLSRRLELVEELCDGLAYAHRAGLVHRDIKPANLMVDADGVLKILDFGIVRADESGITQSGVLVGTINYMSPEQVLGTAVDHRSDIFAVGLVAYELLTGKQAFPGAMRDGLLHRIPSVTLEPIAKVLPGLDPEVVSIVEQALRREPAERYQDLARMRNDLARVRQRIRAAEEQAAVEAVAAAGETAFIASEPTVPGVMLEPPPASASALVVDAERALAEGNYRAAMTIAGRSAAIDPAGRHATGIVARAEARLLERGRSLEGSSGLLTPGGSVATPQPGLTPAAGSQPGTGQTSRSNFLAVGVAVVALIVAAVALWPRLRNSEQPADPSRTAPVSTPSQEPQREPPPPAPVLPVPAPVQSAESVPASPPASSAANAAPPTVSTQRTEDRRAQSRTQPRTPPAPAAPAPAVSRPEQPAEPPVAAPVPVGGNVREPRRTHYVAPAYPASAIDAGVEGTVVIELTIGREGRVADARVVRSIGPLDNAALAAVRQWEFEPTVIDGRAVPVIHTVNVPFTLPPRPKPQPALPEASAVKPVPPPPAAASPAAVPKTAETPKPAPPPTPAELREQAVAEVREALRRFEAAWESLDEKAIARAQVLSSGEADAVRRMIQDAESYSMDISDPQITVDPDNRSATVICTITRRFRPRVGTAQTPRAARNTLRLEKRGDTWVIVSVR